MTTQDIMEQVTADYITANSPLSPVREGLPERADQLHGLERRHGAELSDARSVSVVGEGRGPAAARAAGPQPDREERGDGEDAERDDGSDEPRARPLPGGDLQRWA